MGFRGNSLCGYPGILQCADNIGSIITDTETKRFLFHGGMMMQRLGWVLIALSLSTLAIGADINTWTTADIFGGQIWSLAMNPYDHNVLLAGGIKKLYKSTDGAATWQPTSISGLVTGIAFAASDSTVAYVCAGGTTGLPGIYKSLDCGQTWVRLNTPAQFERIITDPTDANTVYTCDRQINPAHIFKSTDGGNQWDSVYTLPVDFAVSRLAMAGDHVIVTTQKNFDGDGAIFYSPHGGANWTQIPALAANCPVYSLAVDPAHPNNVYAGGRSLFFKSADWGEHWSTVDVGGTLGSNGCRTIMLTVMSGANLLACNGMNLYTSADAGDHWNLMGPVDPANGGGMGNLCDPINDGTHVYLADSNGCGIYKSTNGATFHEANVNIRGVRFLFLTRNPIEKNVVYAGSDVDLYRSKDSGQTWTRLNALNGLRAGVGDTIVSPVSANSVLAYQQGGPAGNAIIGSDDYGDTWRAMSSLPFEAGGVLQFAFNPGNTAVVYAGVGGGIMSPRTGDGLYKSTDSGNNWSRIAFAGSVISNIVIDPGNTLTMYAGKGQFCQGLNPNTTGAFKTTDGGSTWQPLAVPMDTMIRILIDPDDAMRVYIATKSSGLYQSADKGATWMRSNAQWGISALAITKITDGKKAICFSTDSGDVYVSVDEGTTWSLYSTGFDVINTLCPGSLYAGTDSGLYRTEIDAAALPTPEPTTNPGNANTVRAYPNPGAQQIRFALHLNQTSQVIVDVYNMNGERVARLQEMATGDAVLTWNCQQAGNGVYMSRIRVDGHVLTKLKVAVVK
jgi:photosystem II stability/assembly factor-like uncharacterized protein